MKNSVTLLFVLFLAIPAFSYAEEFLGLPVIQGGQLLEKTDSKLTFETTLSHDEVLLFYRDAVKDLKDIRFREWKEATYIEDDGRLPWHSITISKGDKAKTTVTIVKDNWTWIIGTLVLRYVGVFVVLMILLLSLAVAGNLTSRFLSRPQKAKEAH